MVARFPTGVEDQVACDLRPPSKAIVEVDVRTGSVEEHVVLGEGLAVCA
jgi:hypothetical protein